ncbi:MAG: hypothetical protein COX66_01460 [Elusimicrobia bacterium CG_4_10_14_0_2_um_filter_63_34]|nr:MAG: hypothetical protein COX66_01460 [Elusimicrobia bacterium CG_4_10_14_0_2_um_filter_63_34]
MAERRVRPRKERRSGAPASSVPSLVKDLVDQFDRPLDFFRELIQNAIDAGSNRIDVTIERGEGDTVIRIEDDGEGMDEYIIDNFLLVLFRSTKEEDFTKIGKFGIGFVSVFSLRPELVRVLTARNGESWRVDFPSYRRYEKYKLSSAREGTMIEIRKKQSEADFEKLGREARETILYWCKHSEARIFYRVGDQRPEALSEPFGLAGASLAYTEEGTELRLAFSAADKPFFGFYNRGLTLKEGSHDYFRGVSFKAKSRYLEHTLTRDSVMEDENYRKLMGILEKLVENRLPEKLRFELKELSTRISKIALQRTPDGDGLPEGMGLEAQKAVEEWTRRLPFLHWLLSTYWSRWRRSDWRIFPGLCGETVSLEELKDGVRCAPGKKLYFDSCRSRVTQRLEKEGAVLLCEGPWVEAVAEWLGVDAVHASKSLILPVLSPDQKLSSGMRAFLNTLRELDRKSGSKYRGIAAADLAYPGSPIRGKLFVTQREAGEMSPVDEKPVSSLFVFRTRRWAVLNISHPSAEKFARLHAARPGFAAFLCLKMMHLHDGEVPPEREGEYSNLAEKVEGKLLEGALELDSERAS